MAETESTPLRSASSLNHELDALFERYLYLLDKYTTIRRQLSSHLSSGFFSLAQANFQNTTHTRYGQDYYDERMQASRRINIEESSDKTPIKYDIVHPKAPKPKAEKLGDEEPQLPTPPLTPPAITDASGESGLAGLSIKDTAGVSKNLSEHPSDSKPLTDGPSDPTLSSDRASNVTDTKKVEMVDQHPEADAPKPTDPLKWFGILIPPALRKAQGDFVQAVEDIPRLVSVAAEMRTLEREVGHLRKEMKKAGKVISSQCN